MPSIELRLRPPDTLAVISPTTHDSDYHRCCLFLTCTIVQSIFIVNKSTIGSSLSEHRKHTCSISLHPLRTAAEGDRSNLCKTRLPSFSTQLSFSVKIPFISTPLILYIRTCILDHGE
ncbi:hypothetical protein P692DRAFT_20317929 [Suillus brevipes Sb2]|nr:hypothetical protein P692DRAFT_20317929 [Suillus brevipes Sb2]